MYTTIEVHEDASIVTVSLNRPEVRNAFDGRMIGELTDVFTALARRDDVRVVVLRGNGPSFSAGADAQWMRASLEYSRQENIEDAGRVSDMFHAIDVVPQPVVARVHGAALGGGMGLMAVCDIVVAAEGTTFGFTEARLGIIPAVISRFVLPRVGPGWARALFLTAERFGPDVARQIGLVHWVCPLEQLDPTVDGKVADLLSSGPVAVRAAKLLIREMGERDDSARRDLTVERIAELRTSPEGQEGLRAFLERRRPEWQT